MDRVLVIAAKTAYQTDDLARAAEAAGVEPVLATDRCHILAEDWPVGAIPIDFRDPERGAAQAIAAVPDVRGVVATDEVTAVIAAIVGERLGLPHNDPAAARAAGDKRLLREALAAAGVAQPAFRCAPLNAGDARGDLPFPVVIKPRHLSTSRGVMRADDDIELARCVERLRRLLADPEIVAKNPVAAGDILVEAFVPGDEVAFEGLLRDGALTTLAVFDKPEPLNGPFFAETMYVTPSRQDARAIADAVAAAAAAIGLREGPVHAELRVRDGEPVVIEVAARAIGGLCGRVLRYGTGVSVEDVVVAHAAGREVALRELDGAVGVLMLPAVAAGVLRSIGGEDAARAVDGVREVTITARVGDVIVPLPEGNAYMGFAFASGATPADVVAALDGARAALRFDIAKRL